MIGVANNKDALKKRVERFFRSERCYGATKLISDLIRLGDILVFGGLIRDIALYGTKYFNSDIDLVIDCTQTELDKKILENHPLAARNKFGGYRIHQESWTIDLWPIKETWAFKENLVEFRDISSLLLTTVTNWDSVAYSFKSRKIICSNHYLDDLKEGKIDIVLSTNPNKLGALIRLLRAIFDKKAVYLMPKAIFYLREELNSKTAAEILDAQSQSFNREFFTASDIEKLRSEINSLSFDLFGGGINPKGKNLSFKLGSKNQD
ncbi:MAG: hypothetical protein QW175_07705 [Candidatus Bathyarchaeia archaeon]